MVSIVKVDLFDYTLKKICYQIACQSDHDVGMTHEWLTSLWQAHFSDAEGLTFLVKNRSWCWIRTKALKLLCLSLLKKQS